MAATAVSELSMDPPSLLVCVNKNASIYEPLSHAERFGVNILHHSHRRISENCSGAVKGEARFAIGAWTETEDGVPYLRDAQACIFCYRDQRVDYGTHGVFFGRVIAAHTTGDVSPLIYVNGQYSG
jgi:flavin reductase (DIM6/NTAB) family NADH-FMN oxidoreductase RutF